MKSLGHYTIEIIRDGTTIKISAGGVVAVVSVFIIAGVLVAQMMF